MAIEDELSGLNRELSMFPERAFEFSKAGEVVIEQDVADVGSIVWDAEILLAHYLDQAYGSRLSGMRVLELGAGTGLAGLSKLLPTLIANARANAQDLEYSRQPPTTPGSRDGTSTLPCDEPADVLSTPPESDNTCSVTTTPSIAKDGGKAEDVPVCRKSARRRKGGDDEGLNQVDAPKDSTVNVAASKPDDRELSTTMCCLDGGGIKGCWRVVELLFSESEEKLLRWRRMADGGGTTGGPLRAVPEGDPEGDSHDGLFDLVVAADVVYLNDLWDAMAFTIKALTKPSGEALMTFEQRRGNVDGFFGPPRFGGEETGCCWGHGEEVDFAEGVDAGEVLRDAAKAARVRMYRMRRSGSGGP
ncbi:expressed unknown protein [Ectocarpus siliculosus]|uniref:Uncharacterized protein n=1 Tax=Ectocarpus siliculosus TaxID=2880 RepID=D8LD99_ECTSI|nr:expressed unknown protein [Ectocarpus siliculosus]|eukprot:CBN80157.1 expressed unknown protein [Ectocarpus siliculosus]